ncbi:uncharacterized protein LOC127365800 [Dicentrarchus labrax]|uniref:uncharacterized protein LOC127365800 n=1 Tax=Dicentrarchus labrax TaxID=13489 RepID=UPI0021F69968|nr:uncharacterized protein LOC127365800 [Dicentrarchus labrax]
MNGENLLTALVDGLEDSWDGNALESIQEAENQALQTPNRIQVPTTPTRVEEDLRSGVSLPSRSKTPQKRPHPCVFHGEIGGICEEDTPAASPDTPVQKKRRDTLSPGSVDQAPTAVVNPSLEAPLQRCERPQNQQRTPDPEADGAPDVQGRRTVTTAADVHAVPSPSYMLTTPGSQALPCRSVSPAPRTPLVVPETPSPPRVRGRSQPQSGRAARRLFEGAFENK